MIDRKECRCAICAEKSEWKDRMLLIDAPEQSDELLMYIHETCMERCVHFWVLQGAPDLSKVFEELDEMKCRKAKRMEVKG